MLKDDIQNTVDFNSKKKNNNRTRQKRNMIRDKQDSILPSCLKILLDETMTKMGLNFLVWT